MAVGSTSSADGMEMGTVCWDGILLFFSPPNGSFHFFSFFFFLSEKDQPCSLIIKRVLLWEDIKPKPHTKCYK